ncbi:SRPBCC family protein [Bdellovibrio sp. HCB209]|uniref:SRPBCC family protein n=1 Tax=Bdellovibrio sp. HCB209 TaxID=3394354 RepID=UPI0039B68B69
MKKRFETLLVVLSLGMAIPSLAQIKMFKSVAKPTKGIMVTYPAKPLSISINRNVNDVYSFMSNPENMPLWAAGLSKAKMEKSGDEWIAQSPMGKVKVRFAEKNKFGVVDHDVTLPSGEVNHNPLRAVRNGDGTEVTFTLYRLPRMTDIDFENDSKAVQKDLEQLKRVLENK